jgi:hypothetical protein
MRDSREGETWMCSTKRSALEEVLLKRLSSDADADAEEDTHITGAIPPDREYNTCPSTDPSFAALVSNSESGGFSLSSVSGLSPYQHAVDKDRSGYERESGGDLRYDAMFCTTVEHWGLFPGNSINGTEYENATSFVFSPQFQIQYPSSLVPAHSRFDVRVFYDNI